MSKGHIKVEISCCLGYSEGDPSLYHDYYVSLKSFIEASLDVHKVKTLTYLYIQK